MFCAKKLTIYQDSKVKLVDLSGKDTEQMFGAFLILHCLRSKWLTEKMNQVCALLKT